MAAVGPYVWRRSAQNFFRVRSTFAGEIKGAASGLGHLLRGAGGSGRAVPTEPIKSLHVPVAIVGGGIAGLSAAWRLKKRGFDTFQIFELEKNAGGNSVSGENAVSAYPWGAHYVPIPTENSVSVRELFQDLGIITGHDAKGLPIYNELFVCQSPQERLLIDGVWQEGVVPRVGLSAHETASIEKFVALVEDYRARRGNDGRPYFTIPVDLSSQDPRARALDQITMKDFLRGEGLNAKALDWYVNYCCRDDFGTPFDQVSAWAGLHYFAARGGESANTESHALITWPEGNGWLAKRLTEMVGASRISTSSLVKKISQTSEGAVLDVLDAKTMELTRVTADEVIYAAPHFTAPYIVADWKTPLTDFEYAPWLVGNITLRGSVPRAKGFPLAWDNVSYTSESLGYVVATHQKIRRYNDGTVLTFYWPLSHLAPKEARREALAKTHADWTSQIVTEMEKMHPGISAQIESVDVWVWGHGMIRPVPGFIWGESRRLAKEPLGRIHFAHSDLSGLSIFEEAQAQGVRAADEVLKRLRKPAHA